MTIKTMYREKDENKINKHQNLMIYIVVCIERNMKP